MEQEQFNEAFDFQSRCTQLQEKIHTIPVDGLGEFYVSETDIVLVTKDGEFRVIDESNFDKVGDWLAA